MKPIRLLIIAATLSAAGQTSASEASLAVPLDFRLVRNVLVGQLYTGEGQTARVWKDGKQCSFLDLSNPQINGERGQVRIDNDIHARFGTKMGGKCMTLIEWSGILQTDQQPTLDTSGAVLSFPVTQTHAFDRNGQPLNIGQLQDLLKKVAEPQLAALKIDLNQSRDDIIKLLLPYVSADRSEQLYDTVNSLRFKQVGVTETGLKVSIGFNSPRIQKADKTQEPAFDASELQQWQAVWQDWQQSLQKAIDKAPMDTQSDENRALLQDVLTDAGTAFEAGLSGDIGRDDPVRQFFNHSWDKLGPLLRNVSKQFPGTEALRYLTLIAATDLIYQVESVTAPLGLEISSNGLRKLARSYLSHHAEQPNG